MINKTQIAELRLSIAKACDNWNPELKIHPKLLEKVLDQLEAEEARIAELGKAKTIDAAHSKRGWSEAHAQEERAEKAEAELAELREAISTKITDAKLHNTQMSFEQGEEIKTLKAEIAALRGAAVPVAEIKMFPFPGCKFGERRPAMAWVGKQDKDFPVGTKFYTHPAPPVVVLPSRFKPIVSSMKSLDKNEPHPAMSLNPEGGWLSYGSVVKILKDAGITVKPAEEGISIAYPDSGWDASSLFVKDLNPVSHDALNAAASDQPADGEGDL